MLRTLTFFLALFLLLPFAGEAQKKALEPVDTTWYNPGDINYNLLVAAYLGLDKDVERFLREGAYVNTMTMNGSTPLMLAAGQGHLSTVQLLVMHDADVEEGDKQGTTPLMNAVINGHAKIVSFLLRSGASPHARDRAGRTPLLLAAVHNRPAIALLLLDKGADPDGTDKQGTTPLMAAIYAGNNNVARLLIEKEADPNKKDEKGFTPLLIAVQQGNREMISLLLSHGADLQAVTRSGYSALLLAIQEKDTETARLLLEKDTTGFFRSKTRPNPVSMAVDNKDPAMKELLIDNDFSFRRTLYLDNMHLGGELLLNGPDFMPGIFFSLTEGVTGLALQTGFLYRAFPARILQKETENTFWQLREYRGIAYAGLGREFAFSPKKDNQKILYGADLLISVIYSFGPQYSGSMKKPPDVVTVSPSAGLFLNIGAVGIHAGYAWVDLQTYDLSRHHFSLRISWIINRKKITRTEKTIPWYKK
jgi:ankyrin repeat protein